MTTPESFVEALRKLKFEDTFNPYSDRCTVHDLYDAPSIRSKTLEGLCWKQRRSKKSILCG